MTLTSPSEIGALLSKHHFTFSKALGQNFLINPSVCPRMAEIACPDENYLAIEIGPGFGVLTKELAKRAKKVLSIELDKRLFSVLEETLAGLDNVELLHGDALKLNLAELIAQRRGDLKVCICANLPYYITSPIIMKLLEDRLPLESITVMVQKEAATRLAATPGAREVGAVSLAVSYYSIAKVQFQVSRGSFIPSPKVDSAVISLYPREAPPYPLNEADFFRIVRGAFAQRRKTLANSLSSYLSLPKDKIFQLLAAAQISPSARAEELTLEDFCLLSNHLGEIESNMQ